LVRDATVDVLSPGTISQVELRLYPKELLAVMKRFLSPFLRFFALAALVLLCLGLIVPLFLPGTSAQTMGPRIWLKDSQSLPVTYTGAGASAAMSPVSASIVAAQPVAMAQGDFNQDGFTDLAVGFSAGANSFIAIHRGNIDAFAPQSDASFQAIARSEFPSPFLPEAKTFPVPISPDFIAAGDFTGQGGTDLAVAARGGSTIYIFAGDGKGNFTAGQTIPLGGGITSLGAGQLGGIRAFSKLLVGVSSRQQTFLAVYGGGQQGMAPLAAFPLSAPATNILFGDFGDIGPDAAFLSGGEVVLLHSSSMQLETLSLPVSATAMALGSFVSDRVPGPQIALLDSSGAIQIAAHREFDPRAFTLDELKTIRRAVLNRQPNPLAPQKSVATHGWKIVESIPSVTSVSASQPPLLFRTRISSNAGDDVMVLNGSTGQMAVVSHPDVLPGATNFLPAQVSTRPYSGSPVAAIPARVNVDARPGVLAVHQGEMAPRVMAPLPDPTFFVNRTDDPVPGTIAGTCNNVSNVDTSTSCSLREAILKANATLGTDTVQLAAGTYTLSQPRSSATPPLPYDAATGTLDVTDSVNIVGAGQATTIIQGGTIGVPGAPNGVDKVFSFNQDIVAFTNASVSVSNLTIQNGFNRGNTTLTDGWGGAFDFDTGGTNPATATATLTLTNVTLTNNTLTDGEGGGFAIFNTNGGTGNATFTNCIIQNNVVSPTVVLGNGGGGFVSTTGILTLTTSQVLNNSANTGIVAPNGGGMELLGNATGGNVTVHGSTISGNSAGGQGGGIFNNSNLTIDTSSIISNNTSGSQGGGLFLDSVVPDTTVLNKVTITGNTATASGGGIRVGNLGTTGQDTLSLHFSRLAGNTAPLGTANLENVNSVANATDNWWGTNTPATKILDSNAGVTTFDPFIVLTNTPNPAIVNVNSSTTLTASFLQDNHGTAIPVGNLDVLIGVPPASPLPITFNNAILGTISSPQATIQNTGTATATFTAGPTGLPGPQPQAHADAVVDNGTATANITIPLPPVLTKTFGAASIPLNGTTSLSFTINNPNTSVGLSGIAFSDTLPAGLVISTPNGQTGTCGGGTITATQGTNVISLSGASLAASASCTFSVNVTGTAAGTQNNTTGAVTSTEGGAGGTASTSTIVVAPPSIAKAFGAAAIPLNATTSLTFTITNPAANTVAEAGVAFSDTLPTGLVVATPNGLTNNCGGTAAATAGTTGISLTGGSIAVNTSCTVVVNVTGTASGLYTNTSGAVSSTNGGTGNTASANLTVATPPTVIKAFGASQIPLNGATSLTFTINNPNTNVALTGIAFTDSLPAGLVVATPANLNNTCGGTATAVSGAGTASLSGATLATSASCTVSVNVTGTTAGVKNNSVTVTSTEGGTGNTSNASITVIAPPTIAKAFGAASIPLGGSTSLTFTISNPNSTHTLTGIAFSDTLPAGLVISTPNGLSGTCPGTVIATAGSNVISATGVADDIGGFCTVVVNVTGTAAGLQLNTTGPVTSTEGGTGATSNTASLPVLVPPTAAKAFNPPGIPPNGVSTMTITITNPPANAAAMLGVAITDNFPANLVVATPNGLTNNCGGTATATAGSGTVSLTGGSVATNSSCTVSVNVTSSNTGSYLNTTGAPSSTNSGTGNSASATLAVANPPTISKLFLPNTTVQNGTSLLSFTITNPNSNSTPPNSDVTLTGISFTDNLPAGLVVASPNALSNDCDGTVTAVPGSSSVTLTGGDLAPAVGLIAGRRAARSRASKLAPSTPTSSGQCFISVKVQATAIAPATLNNSVLAIMANESGQGAGSNTASLTVTAPPTPPTLAKAFVGPTIPANTPTPLTFTVGNPASNSVALTNISFTDNLPSGLAVASPSVVGGTCSADVVANAGSNNITVASVVLSPNTSCTVVVNVIGTSAGLKTNVTSAVTAAFDDGTGTFIPITGLAASASVTVLVPDLTIAKSHSGNFTQGDAGDTYTITVSNIGSAPTTGTVTVTDNLPAFLIVAPTAMSGTGWTCPAGTLTCTRSDALANGASYPPITLTVAVAVNAPPTLTNSVTVSGGGEVNTANDTATDPTTINQLPGPPLTIGLLVPSAQTIKNGNSAQWVFDVVSHSATLGNISFACSGLPAGAACSFNPQTENTGDAQVTMTLTTTPDVGLVWPRGLGKPGPMYAALLFPVIGLVSLAAAGRRGKKNRMRLVMFLGGLLVLMALFGCGGTPHNGTPIGQFTITVTATSAGNSTVTASTQVTVTVQ
jgi:uncharacterized repeat protein (TIGR01451 family)